MSLNVPMIASDGLPHKARPLRGYPLIAMDGL
jgi:hypothetical protein